MKKFVAVVGCTLSIVYDDPTVTGGVITITSPPSTKISCDRKKVYRGPLSGSVVGAVGTPDFVQGVPSIFTIQPSTTKTTADGKFVIRAEDAGTVSIVLTKPSGATKTVTGTIKVVNAGQQKVSSN